MTIAASLLASDGVVLASDSTATILTREGRVSGLLTGAQKIFQFGMNKPYGIVLFGNASFGRRSYRDVLAAFSTDLGAENPPILGMAQRLHKFFQEQWVI